MKPRPASRRLNHDGDPVPEPAADLRAELMAELRAFEARLEVQLAEILGELRGLRADQAAARAPRAEADAELLRAVADAMQQRTFAAWEVVDLARDAGMQLARLRAALETTRAMDPQRLGLVLKRLAGVNLEGLMVVRKGENRDGALWAVRESRE